MFNKSVLESYIMYETPKKISQELGIHPHTLRRWANEEKITAVKTVGGHRRYDLNEVVIRKCTPKRNVCYCRVASNKQKEDLARQINTMKLKYPEYEIISDIGSGMSYKRKGFTTLLDLAITGQLGDLVLYTKDQLCRFGFDIVKQIIVKNGGKVTVLHVDNKSSFDEFSRDLFRALAFFSNRIPELNKYIKQMKKDPDMPQGKG